VYLFFCQPLAGLTAETPAHVTQILIGGDQNLAASPMQHSVSCRTRTRFWTRRIRCANTKRRPSCRCTQNRALPRHPRFDMDWSRSRRGTATDASETEIRSNCLNDSPTHFASSVLSSRSIDELKNFFHHSRPSATLAKGLTRCRPPLYDAPRRQTGSATKVTFAKCMLSSANR